MRAAAGLDFPEEGGPWGEALGAEEERVYIGGEVEEWPEEKMREESELKARRISELVATVTLARQHRSCSRKTREDCVQRRR